MAVTITTVGNNTATVAYEAGDSLAAIRALVQSFVTGHGWVLHEATAGSDVFKSLDYGGTPGVASHYSYAELDYSVTDRVCLRQWLSWSAGVGSSKAQNLYCVNPSNSNAALFTESQVGQPLSPALGGSLQLNVARGRLFAYGAIPGLAGNVCNNAGSLVIERMRVHPSDIVGANPGCMFAHVGQMFYANMGVAKWKWSMPKDVLGGSNTTVASGDQGGFRVPETLEAYYYYPNAYPLSAGVNAIDSVDGSVNAGAVFPMCGLHPQLSGIGSNTHIRFGALQGAIRKYGAAAGDIITAPADALGIPSPGGTPTEYLVVVGGLGLVR